MELDDLKAAWAAHGEALGRAATRPHPADVRRRLGGSLRCHLVLRTAEVGLGLLVLAAACVVLAAHPGERRYLAVGSLFAGFVAVAVAQSARLAVLALRLDPGAPVVALQGGLARLRRAAVRAFLWALLGGVLCWLPALLVLFEALTGVPALGRVDLPWLLANLAFGLVALVVGHRLAKRHVDRPDLGPWARRFVDAVSGRGLRAAARELDELAGFVRDGDGAP